MTENTPYSRYIFWITFANYVAGELKYLVSVCKIEA